MRGKMLTSGPWVVAGACLAACLGLSGCAGTGAPDGWLPVVAEAARDPYGAWITVEFDQPYDKLELRGEFLAVDNDSVYVLLDHPGAADPVVGVSRMQIKKARVASYDPETYKAGGWVAAGAIGSLSNGAGAVISLPLWLIMGSATAGGHSRTALESSPDTPWFELRKFARFPAGPPAGMRELGLRGKTAFEMVEEREPVSPDTTF